MAERVAMDGAESAAVPNVGAGETSRKTDSRLPRLVVTGGLVVLLAVLFVRLVYSLMTPLPHPPATPPAIAESGPQTDLTIFSRFDPFEGNVPAPEAAPIETAEETRLNLKLFGTFLGDTPSAIVQGTDNRQGVYFLGDEITSGVKIREIRPNQILLDRRGALETLTLENRDAGPSGGAMRGTAPRLPGGVDAGTLGELADIVRIQPGPDGRGFLLYAGRKPELFAASGLQDGDNLISIDGERLHGNMSRLSSLPILLASEPVIVTVERAGTPLEVEIDLTGLTP
ncbi:type II secretion system protein N [Parvularcula marina]|uniref:type II secretion system protein N n=1 Tax=Parvularcula marina TaxID=2292771 RepID=UPI003512F0D5